MLRFLITCLTLLKGVSAFAQTDSLTQNQIDFFHKNGYLIIKDFASNHELSHMKKNIDEVAESLKSTEQHHFSRDKSTMNAKHFYRSAQTTSCFFEEASEGSPNTRRLNKIGHTLHRDYEVFKDFSHQERVQKIARSLGIKTFKILQSMYIFKHPFVGGEVTWHQDRKFLFSEPSPLLGFWMPLEDTTEDNGCLWVVPGSHKQPLKERLIVDENLNMQTEHYDYIDWDVTEKVSVPMQRGSLLLIHGHLLHMSHKNTSAHPRPAYTFHMVDKDSYIPANNWIRAHERL